MAEAYQTIEVRHPRFPLATFPTPLERAQHLEAALAPGTPGGMPRIYLKRDDLLSLGMGGNKVRNLEFAIGQALAESATEVVTSGRQQSNHCRLTAAACARAGLGVHVVLSGREPASFTGNLLLGRLLGSTIHFVGSDDRAVRQQMVSDVAREIAQAHGRPYVIPVGGSDARGALGHALAAEELLRQCDALGERLGALVLATATGGTQAGMLAGLRRLGSDAPIYGFAVAKSAPELAFDVLRMANEVSRAIGGRPLQAPDVIVDGSCLGEGYGAPTLEGQRAIEVLARSEGVFADPVYTGKALAGLFAFVREGRLRPGDCVVFLHTGGTPALFA